MKEYDSNKFAGKEYTPLDLLTVSCYFSVQKRGSFEPLFALLPISLYLLLYVFYV